MESFTGKKWTTLESLSMTTKIALFFFCDKGKPVMKSISICVRPDMRYCSRSRCFHPDLGTKHISVPPRHMTIPYAPDFQHDITTLQIQGYNISYNRHTTALKEYNSGRYMSEYRLQSIA